MAKDQKKSEKSKSKKRTSRGDQVRSAVDQAFQTAGAQLRPDRAADIADDLAAAAQRVREAVEDALPPTTEDLKRLEERLAVIERRIGALERATPASTRREATKKPAAAPRKKAAPSKKAAPRKPAS